MKNYLFLIFISIIPNISIADQLSNCTLINAHDDDTIKVQCPNTKDPIRVRFYCIDAPEKGQPFWDASLSDLSKLTNITIDVKSRDMYGRSIGEVFNKFGINVNKYLVSIGSVAVYPEYCTDPEYYDLETDAKNLKSGIWSEPNTLSQTPWIYRYQKKHPK